jgi:hypothetical protein
VQADEAKPENGYFCEWMAYQVGQAAMSGDGTFETCRRSAIMSACGVRPEVSCTRSKRRE